MGKKIMKPFFISLGRFILLSFLPLCLFINTLQAEQHPNSPTANTSPTILLIKKVPLTVNGKTTEVFRIEQPDGTWGFEGVEGDTFNAIVKNTTNEPTVLHWHGLILPNDQDGVPDVTQAVIPPGGQYAYRFPLVQSGTYWMHSHYQSQLQQLMSAPFIIHPSKKDPEKTPEIVMLLTDFSFKDPQTLWAELRAQVMNDMKPNMPMTSMSNKGKAAPDLVEVQYDAFLTNYQTLSNPQIIRIMPGKTVRLRLINGAAATNFFVKLGKLKGQLVAVDGEAIVPLENTTFDIAMGQRVDILVTLPKEDGSYPILAQGEGTNRLTGLIVATPNAKIPTLNETVKQKAGAMTLQQEQQLQALEPLPNKPIDRQLEILLEGNMQTYIWKLNGKEWPAYAPLMVKKGERVALTFRNPSPMSHPMHLHGHVFQVTDINGKPLNGAKRDTLLIPAEGTVTVQLEANNSGNWLIHCHVLYHAEGGMMTLLTYENVPLPKTSVSSPENIETKKKQVM